MKIYLGAASAEMERAEKWMARLREAGHEITFDWIAHMESMGPDSGLTDEERADVAIADWRGILTADLTWILAPIGPSPGVWSELALSLSVGLGHTVISGPGRRRSVFAALANEFETDEEAFSDINRGCFE